MSLSKEQMIELMQYADGELAGDDRKAEHDAVKAKLASSDEARTFLSEISKLGAWVEQAERISASRAGSFDIADSVMDRIDALDASDANANEDDSRTAETARTPPIKKTEASPVRAQAPSTAPSIGSIDVAREKRRRMGVFVVTALAAAAGIAFLLRHPAEEPHATLAIGSAHQADTVSAPSARANLPPASSEAAQTLANTGDKAGEPGVEVNVATDSSQTGVSVFYLPGTSSTAASAVVWIDDDTGGKN